MTLARSIGLLALALAAACGGGNGGGGPGPTPTSLAKAATATGDSQVASPSANLPAPFRVIVRDQDGNPLGNVDVTWSVVAGGGSIAPATSPTDANGIATATSTLGTGAGVQTSRATRTGLSGSPVTFTAFGEINGAMTIAASGPTPTSVTDTVLSTIPVAVTVTNHTGAGVSGVIVSWSVSGGGGGLSQAVDTTDGSGVSSVNWTLGSTAGNQAVQASITGLAGSPITFSGGAAGTATQMALNGGNNQVGIVNSALPTVHSVIVRDGHGNPKPGVAVTWGVYAGGGSISPTNPSTGSNGVASVQRTLGASPGPNTDTARVASLSGSPVGFTDTAAARQSITVGDDFYNPGSPTIAAGTFVVWTWAGMHFHNIVWDTSPTLVQSSGTPKTSGTFTLRLTQSGTYTYHCEVHGAAIMSGTITVNP